ncbi:MAG TPA: hypothetical protein VJ302_01595 [Blastocatellia bacterium]|nr:hypothetical protein [Blastocatellia bacterium]
MSDKWRLISRHQPRPESAGFFERHYLVWGLLIGGLIIAFLIVIGGLAFLVWNTR